MPLDLSTVNWVYVGELTAIAFVAAVIGNLLSFHRWLVGAILAAVLFVIGYVFFTNCSTLTSFCPFELPVVNPTPPAPPKSST
jgi:hypothetical protein